MGWAVVGDQTGPASASGPPSAPPAPPEEEPELEPLEEPLDEPELLEDPGPLEPPELEEEEPELEPPAPASEGALVARGGVPPHAVTAAARATRASALRGSRAKVDTVARGKMGGSRSARGFTWHRGGS
jgi:hypothetical protein